MWSFSNPSHFNFPPFGRKLHLWRSLPRLQQRHSENTWLASLFPNSNNQLAIYLLFEIHVTLAGLLAADDPSLSCVFTEGFPGCSWYTHTDIDTHHMSSILHQMVLTIQFPEWDGAVRQQLIYKSIYIFYLKFEIILTGFPLENLVLPGAGRHRWGQADWVEWYSGVFAFCTYMLRMDVPLSGCCAYFDDVLCLDCYAWQYVAALYYTHHVTHTPKRFLYQARHHFK